MFDSGELNNLEGFEVLELRDLDETEQEKILEKARLIEAIRLRRSYKYANLEIRLRRSDKYADLEIRRRTLDKYADLSEAALSEADLSEADLSEIVLKTNNEFSTLEEGLEEVLDFIEQLRSSENTVKKRNKQKFDQPGLHLGAISTRDDFDDPLPDEFGLGEEKS